MIGSFPAGWPARYPGNLAAKHGRHAAMANSRRTPGVMHSTMTPQAGCRLTQDG
jgi:hypothetical protein